MARECLELVLEVHAETHRDQVLPGMDASHVVVGTIEAEVPDVLLMTYGSMRRRWRDRSRRWSG